MRGMNRALPQVRFAVFSDDTTTGIGAVSLSLSRGSFGFVQRLYMLANGIVFPHGRISAV